MNFKIKNFSYFFTFVLSYESAFGVQVKFSCTNFYDPSVSQKVIEGENLSTVARYRGEWFEVAVPHFNGNVLDFVYRKTNDSAEIGELVSSSDASVRQHVRDTIEKYVRPFGLIVRHFHAVANHRGAKVEARMKDFESLRDKIIDNAKSAALLGKSFEFSKIDDLNGIRLITPFRSDLTLPLRRGFEMSNDEMKKHYARLLNLPIESIERVDIKGSLKEMINGKFYRAIHLTVNMHGVPAEVQIMTEGMATWHHWDHPIVYKSKVTDLNYKQTLKSYSQFWAKLIRNVEDFDGTYFSGDQIKMLLISYGLEDVLRDYAHTASMEWILKIDQVLAFRYGIQSTDRFLGSNSVLDPGDQLNLIRVLAQPTLL